MRYLKNLMACNIIQYTKIGTVMARGIRRNVHQNRAVYEALSIAGCKVKKISLIVLISYLMR